MVNVSMKQVSLPNGEEIAYREREGGDVKVLLVHGNMTSCVHWDVVMETMSANFKVFAVDLRGFGESSYHHTIESIKDFSDDLKLFCDEIGLRDFALAGWSLGGAVAQQFCADYPGYANQLILIASASTRGYAYYATGENGLPDTLNRLHSLEEVRTDGKTKLIQGAYDTNNYDLLRQTWNMLIYRNREPDPERYDHYLADMTTQRNLAETYHVLNWFNISNVHNGLVDGNGKMEHITIPVLIAWGNEDLVVTKQMTDELIEDYGEKAIYKELPGSGHSPLIDNLDQLLRTMEDFLTERTSVNE
ncbi:intracellular short-chain-length polyhydroxyalkanoate depolymerase [Virgibacillus siamensis]|uniref:intracellular short-chain-length polyhydroxyalkanoate depolymerase n=1 Tax=Virgibacillus siamensis TaxID=480071 RepID=UPI0009861EB6|nr:alpha/beta hydrolase [Virgibacillus siamensis]